MDENLTEELAKLKVFLSEFEVGLRDIWPEFVSYREEMWFRSVADKFRILNEQTVLFMEIIDSIKTNVTNGE